MIGRFGEQDPAGTALAVDIVEQLAGPFVINHMVVAGALGLRSRMPCPSASLTANDHVAAVPGVP